MTTATGTFRVQTLVTLQDECSDFHQARDRLLQELESWPSEIKMSEGLALLNHRDGRATARFLSGSGARSLRDNRCWPTYVAVQMLRATRLVRRL